MNESGWWYAKRPADGREGWVPSAFLTLLQAKEETQKPAPAVKPSPQKKVKPVFPTEQPGSDLLARMQDVSVSNGRNNLKPVNGGRPEPNEGANVGTNGAKNGEKRALLPPTQKTEPKVEAPQQEYYMNVAEVQEQARNSPDRQVRFEKALKENMLYVARQAFAAAETTETDMDDGELVIVLNKTGTGWWYIEASCGKGYVPSNFLRLAQLRDYQAQFAPSSPTTSEPPKPASKPTPRVKEPPVKATKFRESYSVEEENKNFSVAQLRQKFNKEKF